MKTLLLLRHAKSSWGDPFLADFDRPLNERGKHDAPCVGRLLRDQRLKPDAVLSSTAKRARKTTLKALEASGYTVDVEWANELYQADPATLIQLLQKHAESCACVLVVGHNPSLQELLNRLTSRSESLPTAALAQIELPIDDWRDLSPETRGTLRNLWKPPKTD